MDLRNSNVMKVLKSFFIKHYYLSTSVLIFLSFPSYDLFFLKAFPFIAWFSMVPLFIYVRDKSIKELFFASFITGLAGNLLAYGWIGNFGAVVPGGYLVILLFLIPSLTVFFTVKIAAAEALSRRFESLRVFIYPAVWILVDSVQSIGFLAFPWTYIGYSQYPFTPFIQVSAVTGILGINFIMILFSTSFALFVYSYLKRSGSDKPFRSIAGFNHFAGSLILAALITAGGFVRLATISDEPQGDGLKIATVQTCISPWENWSGNKYRNLNELIIYTEQAMEHNPDFIIWSESATLETISFRSYSGKISLFDRRLFEHIKKWGKPLFTGEIGVKGKVEKGFIDYYPQNNALLISGEGEVVKTYPKIFLVPFGEWFPYEKIFPAVKRLVDSFGGSSFIPGDKPMLFDVKGYKFGPLICYEGIFHRLCREYRLMGADFLVNITNDGWTDTYNGHFQHFSASVFRAVENGIWVVRAGNTGVSAILDPLGRVTADYPILQKGFFTGSVYPEMNRRTFYSRFGDIILYAAGLFIAGLMMLIILKRKKGTG